MLKIVRIVLLVSRKCIVSNHSNNDPVRQLTGKSFSCVMSKSPAASVTALQTTRLTGYFAVRPATASNFLPCDRIMDALNLTLRTYKTMSSIMILFSSASMSKNESRLLINLTLTFTRLMRYLSWKKYWHECVRSCPAAGSLV